MKINIYYLVNNTENYKIENFNSELIDITLLSNIEEIAANAYRGLVDVLLIDDSCIEISKQMEEFLTHEKQNMKVYFMLNDFSLETIQWGISQNWIDKVIPSSNNSFPITDSVIQTITKDTQLLMQNKQLMQDNRELEFVISQMLLVD